MDRVPVEVHPPAAFERALVQRVVGEEQVDRRLLPEHAHLLIACDGSGELRIGRCGAERAQHGKDARGVGGGQEDVDVDVVGGADAAVVAERLRASERMGDAGVDERALDRHDLLVEQHGAT